MKPLKSSNHEGHEDHEEKNTRSRYHHKFRQQHHCIEDLFQEHRLYFVFFVSFVVHAF